MLPSSNGIAWLEGEEDEGISWAVRDNSEGDTCKNLGMNASSFTSFKSMLETDWFANNTMNPSQNILTNHHPDFNNGNLLLQAMDSSSSCSPAQAFTLDPSQSHSPFFPPKSSFSSLFNVPFDNSFDLDCEPNFLTNSNSPVLPNPELSSGSDFAATRFLPIYDNNDNSIGGGFSPIGYDGFQGSSSGNALFSNRAKILRPLEVLPPVGAQPTLFQKRAALRQGSGEADKLGNWGNREDLCKKLKRNFSEDDDEIDISGSFNYDSDELYSRNVNDNNNTNDGGIGNNSNANSSVTVEDQKGKKKGLPAKNLMAERRRRKKLNDRLYMLRSVVPKISKVYLNLSIYNPSHIFFPLYSCTEILAKCCLIL